MKKFLTLIIFFLLMSSVSALVIDPDTYFEDGTYIYRVRTQINTSSLNVTNVTGVYFAGIEYCDSEWVYHIDTSRECYSDYDGGDSGSGSDYVPPEDNETIPIENVTLPIIEEIPEEPKIIFTIPLGKERELKVNIINLIIVIITLLAIICAIWWFIIFWKRRKDEKNNNKDDFGFDFY